LLERLSDRERPITVILSEAKDLVAITTAPLGGTVADALAMPVGDGASFDIRGYATK
jgi:hypothetical protein